MKRLAWYARYYGLLPIRVFIRLGIWILAKVPGTTFGEVSEMSIGPCPRCVGRSVHGPTSIAVLLCLLCLSHRGMAQDFAVRTLAAFDGASSPKWGGTMDFIKRDTLAGVDGTASLTTRYLQDGRLAQTIEFGGEKVLYRLNVADVFACGNIGPEFVGDNKGFTAGGCIGATSKPIWKALRVSGKFKGDQKSLQDQTWSFAAGVEIDLKGK